MYKKIMAFMCLNVIDKYFLKANAGEPLVDGAIGVESIKLEVSELMKDTIEFTAKIAMRTPDVVEVWGFADEYGAVCSHYTFNSDIIFIA